MTEPITACLQRLTRCGLDCWRDRPALRRAAIGAVLVAAIAIHTASVVHQYPPTSVSQENPIVSGDFMWHFIAAVEGDQFVNKQHRIWGYSPTFMAGYPFGLWHSFSKRGYECVTFLMPFLPIETAYYLWIVGTALITPFIVVVAAAVLGLSRRECLAVLFASLIIYQLQNVVAYFWMFGNITFPLVSAIAVLYAALFYRTFEPGGWRFAPFAAVCLALVFWLHPLVIPIAFFASLAVLWLRRRVWREPRRWLFPCLAVGFGLALVAPWYRTLWEFRDLRVAMQGRGLETGIRYFIMDFFSDRAYLHHFDRRVLFHVILVLGTLGTAHAVRMKRGIAAALGILA